MPYFHATNRERLPSILRNGLGGLGAERQNYPGCEPGTYLSTDPALAVSFLVEKVLDSPNEATNPREVVHQFIVIVVDDSRVYRPLRPDPNVTGQWQEVFFLHDGVIDIAGMPIIEMEAIFPGL